MKKKKLGPKVNHKKLDDIFNKIENDEKELKEIEEITFHQIKHHQRKNKN